LAHSQPPAPGETHEPTTTMRRQHAAGSHNAQQWQQRLVWSASPQQLLLPLTCPRHTCEAALTAGWLPSLPAGADHWALGQRAGAGCGLAGSQPRCEAPCAQPAAPASRQPSPPTCLIRLPYPLQQACMPRRLAEPRLAGRGLGASEREQLAAASVGAAESTGAGSSRQALRWQAVDIMVNLG